MRACAPNGEPKPQPRKEGRSLAFTDTSREGKDEDDRSPVEGRFNAKGMWADPPVTWNANTPEELLSRSESARALAVALETLPAKYRAIVTMRDVGGLAGGGL